MKFWLNTYRLKADPSQQEQICWEDGKEHTPDGWELILRQEKAVRGGYRLNGWADSRRDVLEAIRIAKLEEEAAYQFAAKLAADAEYAVREEQRLLELEQAEAEEAERLSESEFAKDPKEGEG